MLMQTYAPAQAQRLQGYRVPGLMLAQPTDPTSPAAEASLTSTKMIWFFLGSAMGFGIGVAMGTIWGTNALRRGGG